jgi:hypothetical protein
MRVHVVRSQWWWRIRSSIRMWLLPIRIWGRPSCSPSIVTPRRIGIVSIWWWWRWRWRWIHGSSWVWKGWGTRGGRLGILELDRWRDHWTPIFAVLAGDDRFHVCWTTGSRRSGNPWSLVVLLRLGMIPMAASGRVGSFRCFCCHCSRRESAQRILHHRGRFVDRLCWLIGGGHRKTLICVFSLLVRFQRNCHCYRYHAFHFENQSLCFRKCATCNQTSRWSLNNFPQKIWERFLPVGQCM